MEPYFKCCKCAGYFNIDDAYHVIFMKMRKSNTGYGNDLIQCKLSDKENQEMCLCRFCAERILGTVKDKGDSNESD